MGIKGFKSRLKTVTLPLLDRTQKHFEEYKHYFDAYCKNLRDTFGSDIYIVVDAAHLLYVYNVGELQFFLEAYVSDPANKIVFVFDNPPSNHTSSVKAACRLLNTLCGDLTRVCIGPQTGAYKSIISSLNISLPSYTADRSVFHSTPNGEKYVVVSVDNDIPIMMTIYPDCIATAIVSGFVHEWYKYSLAVSAESDSFLPLFVRDICTGLPPIFRPTPQTNDAPDIGPQELVSGNADIGGGANGVLPSENGVAQPDVAAPTSPSDVDLLRNAFFNFFLLHSDAGEAICRSNIDEMHFFLTSLSDLPVTDHPEILFRAHVDVCQKLLATLTLFSVEYAIPQEDICSMFPNPGFLSFLRQHVFPEDKFLVYSGEFKQHDKAKTLNPAVRNVLRYLFHADFSLHFIPDTLVVALADLKAYEACISSLFQILDGDLFPLRPFLVSKCLPAAPLCIVIRKVFTSYDPNYGHFHPGQEHPVVKDPWEHIRALVVLINPSTSNDIRWMPGLLSITELSQVMQNITVYGDELRKLMTYPSKPKFPPVLPSGKEIEELKCELLGHGIPIDCHFICKANCSKQPSCTGFHGNTEHVPQDMVQLASYKIGSRLCVNGNCCSYRQTCGFVHLSEDMLIELGLLLPLTSTSHLEDLKRHCNFALVGRECNCAPDSPLNHKKNIFLEMARVCPFWLLGSCENSYEECRHPEELFGAVRAHGATHNISRTFTAESKDIFRVDPEAARVLHVVRFAFNCGRITADEKARLKSSLRDDNHFDGYDEEILVKLTRQEERILRMDQMSRNKRKIARLENEIVALNPHAD